MFYCIFLILLFVSPWQGPTRSASAAGDRPGRPPDTPARGGAARRPCPYHGAHACVSFFLWLFYQLTSIFPLFCPSNWFLSIFYKKNPLFTPHFYHQTEESTTEMEEQARRLATVLRERDELEQRCRRAERALATARAEAKERAGEGVNAWGEW